MPRPISVPVILIDGPSAGQVIHTDETATAWRVAKPIEPAVYVSLADLGNWIPPQPTLYRITEYGITLPTRTGPMPAYFRRRIGWTEGPEPNYTAMRRHVRAALLEHPDLMPAGAILWPADPADDEPIRILETGDGPVPGCRDMFETRPGTRLMRGTCPCGWRTEEVESRRLEELQALTMAHMQAGMEALTRLLRRGLYSYADYAEVARVVFQANRRASGTGDAPPSLTETIAAANRRADERVEAWRDRADGIYWGAPLEESDANWPSQGGGTCAHVCGPGPDHACDARATTRMTYPLPSGGIRTMPLCAPCNASETAAKEKAHADAAPYEYDGEA